MYSGYGGMQQLIINSPLLRMNLLLLVNRFVNKEFQKNNATCNLVQATIVCYSNVIGLEQSNMLTVSHLL